MKTISNYINEVKSEKIDDQWLNDDKPVKTKDGRQVVIMNINRAEVPNIISGKVKMGDSLFEFTWDDTGKCTQATDQYGNSKQPSNGDNLVKQI